MFRKHFPHVNERALPGSPEQEVRGVSVLKERAAAPRNHLPTSAGPGRIRPAAGSRNTVAAAADADAAHRGVDEAAAPRVQRLQVSLSPTRQAGRPRAHVPLRAH